MSFLSWWSHFGQELHAEQNITPKQLAEAAYNAAKLDTDLQGEWGDGYAEGYRQGVEHQRELDVQLCKPYGLTGECVAIAIKASKGQTK